VKVGILLPTFSVGAQSALVAAAAAAGAQLDGVFAYDHLWPMGAPERPALAPFAVLAVVARRHPQLVVGPLVARVGLVATPHLVNQFLTLESMAPGRVIAALGTGDRLSAAENVAYGLAVRSADERRALLGDTARALRAVMPVWFGAGAAATTLAGPSDVARAGFCAASAMRRSRTISSARRFSRSATWRASAR